MYKFLKSKFIFANLLFFFALNLSLKSQDLITLKNGDSINCKYIETQNNTVIYFIKENKIATKKAIPVYLISNIQKNYFKNTDFTENEIKTLSDSKVKTEIPKYTKDFNIIAGINYSNLFELFKDSPEDSVDEYNLMLSNSYSVDVELRQWISNRVGLGLSYNYYSANASYNKVKMYNGSTNRYENVSISDNIRIQNISPTFYYRTNLIPNLYYINMFAGAEYNYYTNNFSLNSSTAEISGKNFGINFGAQFERKFNKGILAGFKVKYGNTVINKIQYSYDGNSNEIELSGFDKLNLSRINIGIYVGIY